MKRILIAIGLLGLCGCQRGCQQMDKQFQTTDRNYEIIMYSGGDTVFYDKVKTIINSEKNSDGIYYYKGDTLIEVSGDYVVKSIR